MPENLNNIQTQSTKKLPNTIDIVIVLVITMALMLTLGMYFANKFGFWGNTVIQVIVVLIPILYMKFKKIDVKNIIPVKKPKVRHIFGATSLWIGTIISMLFISVPMQYFFPDSMEGVNELNKLFSEQNLITLVFAIALLPALCEEFLFRGFVFSGFKNKFKPAIAIIITSILFGIFHLNLIRFATTALLGISINYAMYKTENIAISSYMHFLNNLFSVLTLKALSGIQNLDIATDTATSDPFAELATLPTYSIVIAFGFYIVVAVLFISIGVYFLRKKDKPVKQSAVEQNSSEL